MTYRLHIPIRCANLIDAPEVAVRRALGSADVWIRAARATGGRLEVAGGADRLRAGGLVRLRSGRRTLTLAIGQDDGLPRLTSASGPERIRIRSIVRPVAAGSLATIDFQVSASVPLLNASFRGRLVRYGEALLGIATLVAREPVRVVAGAVIADGRVLLGRRGPDGRYPGRWELPGGKVQPAETDEQALQREFAEEFEVNIGVGRRIGPEIRAEPDILLLCYRAALLSDSPPRLTVHDAVGWFDDTGLQSLDLLDSDRQLVDSLRIALQTRS